MLIRKIKNEDVKNLDTFYQLMIKDTFTKEGIGDLTDFIEAEIKEKNAYSLKALDPSCPVMMWVLVDDHQILGTIGLAPANHVIEEHYPEGHALLELHTLFVHPNEHNKGYATQMIEHVFKCIQETEVRVVLDSGYTIAKKIWKKKFGTPKKILKDFWAEGVDHHIWDVHIQNYFNDKKL